MPKPKPCKWAIVEKARNVHEYRLREPLRGGQEAWLLFMADAHWDHPKCRLDLLKAHYNEAQERGALITSVGDFFCVMQGQGDKRGDKSSLRSEHQHANYIDRIVDTATDWLTPWKNNLGAWGIGNHEGAIYKYHETDILDRLVGGLRGRESTICKGGYSGWVRCMFHLRTQSHSHRVFYHHGFGGGGPVTKGLIDFNRIAEWVDSDSIVQGHVHWKNVTPVERIRLTDGSQICREQMYFVRCGTYKDEFEDGHHGWHVEKGRGPRPLGGWWLRFKVAHDRVVTDWIEAK